MEIFTNLMIQLGKHPNDKVLTVKELKTAIKKAMKESETLKLGKNKS
jgi:hypothetical protein